MKDKSTKLLRRRVLKGGLAAGGIAASNAMPEKWSKPVINAILLPSHAMTTPITTTVEPLQAECEITGLDQIGFVQGLQSATIAFTISNTGAVPLTFVSASGAYGGNATGPATIGTPFGAKDINPGESIEVFLLGSLSAPTNCGFIGGTFTLTITFEETSCQFVADVVCSNLG